MNYLLIPIGGLLLFTRVLFAQTIPPPPLDIDDSTGSQYATDVASFTEDAGPERGIPRPEILKPSKKYKYKYQLRLEQSTLNGSGTRRVPYVFAINDTPISTDGGSIIYGITDENGYMAPIYLNKRVKQSDIAFTNRIGTGFYTKHFRLIATDTGKPVLEINYSLLISCPNEKNRTFTGRNNAQGDTAAASMPTKECSLHLIL